jgi:predicted GNAT superfamily acetyltransferase
VTATNDLTIRDLRTIPEFRAVMALENEIWVSDEPEDTVGIPFFAVTVKRGGILLGAYDGDRLAGFVYSFPGLKAGRPLQWSHMLGIAAPYRGKGLGRRLKLEQRQRALAMGLDLIEWTYDPLQDLNAFLNFQRLGVIVEEYHLNVYGESSSVLHKGTPTDRFIAQWRLRCPRVTWRAAHDAPAVTDEPADAGVPAILETSRSGAWLAPARLTLGRSEPDLVAAVPGGFSEMLLGDAGLAHAWRLATREVFGHYLARGYRVVAFQPEPGGGGRYRLTTSLPADVAE